MPLTKYDVVNFLSKDPIVPKVVFNFLTYSIPPGAYSPIVADAFLGEKINIRTTGASGPEARASYWSDRDSLTVPPDFEVPPGFETAQEFELGSWQDRASLLHECTHAYLDILDFGDHSGYENEAVAYMAEALYVELLGKPPLTSVPIRTKSQKLAKYFLSSPQTQIDQRGALDLVRLVAEHPHYSSKARYTSDGFNRGIWANILH